MPMMLNNFAAMCLKISLNRPKAQSSFYLNFLIFRDLVQPNGKPVTQESIYSDIPIYNNLIETLKLIAHNGSEAFYRGLVGQKLIESLRGEITMKDLQDYQVVEREPIFTKVGDFQVCNFILSQGNFHRGHLLMTSCILGHF